MHCSIFTLVIYMGHKATDATEFDIVHRLICNRIGIADISNREIASRNRGNTLSIAKRSRSSCLVYLCHHRNQSKVCTPIQHDLQGSIISRCLPQELWQWSLPVSLEIDYMTAVKARVARFFLRDAVCWSMGIGGEKTIDISVSRCIVATYIAFTSSQA